MPRVRKPQATLVQGRDQRSQRASIAPSSSAASENANRSEEHTSELQSRENLVCRLLLEKKKATSNPARATRPARRLDAALPTPPARRTAAPRSGSPRVPGRALPRLLSLSQSDLDYLMSG